MTLDEESDDPEALDFENDYAATGSLDLSGTKTLTVRDLIGGEFTFELWKNGVLLQSVLHDANGNFSFSTIPFDLDDVG